MFEFLYTMALFGGFCLLLSIGWFIVNVFMFLVYKFLDHGKMPFFEYLKVWGGF